MYKDLIQRLREKKSKYNRSLLDEAADAIEKLTAKGIKKESDASGKVGEQSSRARSTSDS